VVETLFESELFGHVRGSFTGAAQDKMGLFEYADKGTLFLDEIGDMPLSTQAKLLRTLQNQEILRVGSLTPRKVDVHVIAATHRDLKAAIAEKNFREDLFYRLSMVEIHAPSLAERKEDLPLLTKYFIEKFSRQFRKDVTGLTQRAQIVLARHDWPGNVRELQNVIERAVIMTPGRVLKLQTRGLVTQNAGSMAPRTLEDAERIHITKTLRETNWVVGGRDGAAARLGLARTTLIAMMQRLGIRREKSGPGAGEPDRPFVAAPSAYSFTPYDTPLEAAFEINPRLNSDSAANFRQTERASART
jgi:transcriptional regulator with GAF, ATPase, and Fis domain